ncbi:winged helix-turn-helix domain-containing protein [Vibrio sp. JC009]|uniref:winged helix-turn-helix domain-containing protein n=1 Tax=Vibrio sp. JC009 TaxID=2912314 RepID=UPI0023B18CDF|nr:winged helix-turn-helix domain-containing protein [Vibrio sp. JC009]WED23464.1 winged helix-turn-helix domain-containing protein [Vibrio sp. JC009]
MATKYFLSDKFVFYPESGVLVENGDVEKTVNMGNNESQLLSMFVRNPNKNLSRKALLDSVWSEQGFVVEPSSLTQSISTLRKLLNDSAKAPEFIKTVPKMGYKLISPVAVESNEVSKVTPDTASESQFSIQALETTSSYKNEETFGFFSSLANVFRKMQQTSFYYLSGI